MRKLKNSLKSKVWGFVLASFYIVLVGWLIGFIPGIWWETGLSMQLWLAWSSQRSTCHTQAIYFFFFYVFVLPVYVCYMHAQCPEARRTSDSLELRITGSYRNQTRSSARAASTPNCHASSPASKRKFLI